MCVFVTKPHELCCYADKQKNKAVIYNIKILN